MILDLAYTSKSSYASNQIRSKSIYLLSSGSQWSTHQEIFVILVNAMTDKTDVHIREKS